MQVTVQTEHPAAAPDPYIAARQRVFYGAHADLVAPRVRQPTCDDAPGVDWVYILYNLGI